MQIVGLGTEIVECLRIGRMIERHGELFLQRVFTTQEIEYCSARNESIQHYSAYWAAKEAILKALGTGWVRGIRWKDVEIRPEPGQRYSVAIAGGIRDLCETRRVSDIHLTLSHCHTHATATAIAVGPEPAEREEEEDEEK